jgi:hypothetical protein
MTDFDRGWSVTRPRYPNFDCEPELTITIRADSWEQAREVWSSMLRNCAPPVEGYPVDQFRYNGLPVTQRMRRYGVTGLVLQAGVAHIATAAGTETAPLIVGHWLAER